MTTSEYIATAPDSLKLLNEITSEANDYLKEVPNLLEFDWNDSKVIRGYSVWIKDVIIYNSLFPTEQISRKIESSSFLKKSLRWTVPIEKIIEQVEFLEKKYPGIDRDNILYWTATLVKINIEKFIGEAIDKICLTRDFENLLADLKKFHRNRRQSPKTIQKNAEKTSDVVNIFAETLVSDNKKAVLENSFKDQEDPGKYITDSFSGFVATLLQAKYGYKKGTQIHLGLILGNSYEYIRMMEFHHAKHTGLNQFYKDLFPLLRLISKDKTLWTEDDYEKKRAVGYENYNAYVIAKVKRILGTRPSPKN